MKRSEETLTLVPGSPCLKRPCGEPCRHGWPVSASSGSGIVVGRRAGDRAGRVGGDGRPAGPRTWKPAPTSGLLPLRCPSCWNAPSRHLAPPLTCVQGSAQLSLLAESFHGLPGSHTRGAASRPPLLRASSCLCKSQDGSQTGAMDKLREAEM